MSDAWSEGVRVHEVADDRALAACCATARAAAFVVLDTEFERTRTYFARLALIQMRVGDDVWLIDPLEVSDAEPLRTLLDDSGVVKVMHSCSEDVEALHHYCGTRPASLIDTQIAAAFAGMRWGVGYAELVENLLEVALDKGETRSDWLARPLSAAQRKYAVQDVVYLSAAWLRLRDRLAASARLSWMEVDCDFQVQEVLARGAPETAWTSVKGAGKLEPRARLALARLASWRESRARSMNRPRGFVVRDDSLIALARDLPVNLRSAADGLGLARGLVRSQGDELQALLDEVREAPGSELPPPADSARDRQLAERMKEIKPVAVQVARDLEMAPEVLARRRSLEDLLQAWPELPDHWQGWRWQLLGEKLTPMLGAG